MSGSQCGICMAKQINVMHNKRQKDATVSFKHARIGDLVAQWCAFLHFKSKCQRLTCYASIYLPWIRGQKRIVKLRQMRKTCHKYPLDALGPIRSTWAISAIESLRKTVSFSLIKLDHVHVLKRMDLIKTLYSSSLSEHCQSLRERQGWGQC